jgi:hypothetical protein
MPARTLFRSVLRHAKRRRIDLATAIAALIPDGLPPSAFGLW